MNYLRHVTTTYDEKLDDARGKVGVRIAYDGINEKVYDAISDVYPELSGECDRQRLRKDQIAEQDDLRRS